ncbi:hypothetical protein V3M60_10270 [Trueperella pyogenes]|uniref:hypothetical protein n=1 Tax=Trueperella pyogenes TaxID=1661 RepID=UPI003499FE24
MSEIDIDVRRFAKLLAKLDAHLPISDAMEHADPQKNGRWWSSQREHMSSWFASQATTGSGAYTRQEPNLSAKTTYNRLQSPEGLIWIAEALGAAGRHAAATPLPLQLKSAHANRRQSSASPSVPSPEDQTLSRQTETNTTSQSRDSRFRA